MKDDCLLSFILLLDVCPLFNLIKWSGLWPPSQRGKINQINAMGPFNFSFFNSCMVLNLFSLLNVFASVVFV